MSVTQQPTSPESHRHSYIGSLSSDTLSEVPAPEANNLLVSSSCLALLLLMTEASGCVVFITLAFSVSPINNIGVEITIIAVPTVHIRSALQARRPRDMAVT
eukprot:CAMPEP_0174350550 /NCGR_PEP_ID=MMETSP0811_2-20130205/7666_1 /TAXON_ID=73025 ORGANISM="Eutreptiella gymnastica-like, Strain CCMP1594" /NCGR_SAMPLE_ID=MMETSP0811_2 /ASSEMBLY_ACC=CAM_ASM_000667 /LENGTH=101 /DNA_ID=CAMNT_0015478967 /DNA_START=1626 /DNA_END=1927 /DNA_ORIENTATION=-